MAILRTYRCEECGEVFEVTLESSDPDPSCPYCRDVVLQWQPGMFSIKTRKSRAMDATQDILERDYGLTDFHDNLREGDVAAKTPVRSHEEREAIEKVEADAKELAASAGNMLPAAQQFFQGQGGPMQVNIAQQALADARANKSASNPMSMLHQAGQRGELPNNYRLLREP